MESWPIWWTWEVELSPHLLKRMVDRGFDEAELRDMLERATVYRVDVEPGRFLIEGQLGGEAWHIIVEPDELSRQLVVVTAFCVGRGNTR